MGELMTKSKGKAELQNIWKLMKLQFYMQRYYYLAAVCIMLFFAVSDILVIAFEKGRCDIDETVFFLGLNVCNVFSVLLMIILFAGNNFLGNEKISMYPGTVRSRVAARFCADYLLIFTMVLWEVVLYLLGCGVLSLLTKTAGNINTDFMFSWDYLVSGTLEMLFVSMTLYNLFMLGYAIITRLGVMRSVVLFAAGVILIYIFSSFSKMNLNVVLEFFAGYDMTFGSYLLCLAGVWLVSALLTWILVLTTRQWKRNNAYIMWAFLIIGEVILKILIFGAHDEVAIYEEDVALTQEAKSVIEGNKWLNYLEPGLYKDSVIEKGERLQDNLDVLDLFLCEPIASKEDGRDIWFNYGEVLTVEQAREQGYVETDFSLPENGIVMRITATAETWNEKFLYEGLLQNLEVVKVKGEFSDYCLEYRLNNYGVVFPAALTRGYARFGLSSVDEYELDGANNLSAILIVDDELKKAYDEWSEE